MERSYCGNIRECVCVFHQVWLLSVLEAVKVSPLIEKVSDHKDFKKLLRTRTNVLVLYTETGQRRQPSRRDRYTIYGCRFFHKHAHDKFTHLVFAAVSVKGGVGDKQSC